MGHLIEIRYEELIEKPLVTLNCIYTRFNLSHFDEMLPSFENYVKSKKDYITNKYSIRRQELDFLACQFDFAIKHWGYKLPQDLNIID